MKCVREGKARPAMLLKLGCERRLWGLCPAWTRPIVPVCWVFQSWYHIICKNMMTLQSQRNWAVAENVQCFIGLLVKCYRTELEEVTMFSIIALGLDSRSLLLRFLGLYVIGWMIKGEVIRGMTSVFWRRHVVLDCRHGWLTVIVLLLGLTVLDTISQITSDLNMTHVLHWAAVCAWH